MAGDASSINFASDGTGDAYVMVAGWIDNL
jgi:hypothetical protein